MANRPHTNAFECELRDAPRMLATIATSASFTPESITTLSYDAVTSFDVVRL
jgi:hypothetical protein